MVYIIPQENIIHVTPKSKSVKENKQNILTSLKFFIICSQLLGILPIENITGPQNKIRFRWKCWKFLYTFFLIASMTVASILCLLEWFYVGYIFTSLDTTIAYAGALIILILYVHLARSWPKLMMLWCKMDEIMNNSYGYPKSLDKRFRIIFIIHLILASGYFSIYTVQEYNTAKLKAGNKFNIETYHHESFPQFFRFIPVNAVSATFFNLIRMYIALVWPTNDLFIILVSIALALRFRQISERLANNQKAIKSLYFWKEIREDYDRLSLLCKELDTHVSYLILLSFSSNIFFILVELYESLEFFRGFPNFIGQLEFVYCFMYHIIKIVSVSMYAAWINDESVEPASILNSVPASSYNIEIRRLLTQISFDNVALTGCRMFKVTRGIILSIAGAVVTYELVLIQFNAATSDN